MVPGGRSSLIFEGVEVAFILSLFDELKLPTNEGRGKPDCKQKTSYCELQHMPYSSLKPEKSDPIEIQNTPALAGMSVP